MSSKEHFCSVCGVAVCGVAIVSSFYSYLNVLTLIVTQCDRKY